MMGYPYYIIDSFTDVAFGGVPVAVFPHANDIPEAYFKALSEEVVSCDTVFIKQIDAAENRFGFESFNEDGACVAGAHGLIAGIAALVSNNEAQIEQTSSLKIDTVEDCIEAFVDKRSKQFPYIIRRKITPLIDYFVPTSNEIALVTGLSGADIAAQKYNCAISNCDATYLFVPLKSYHAVREASFNLQAWSASSLPTSLVDKIVLFAPNTDGSGADFHMRLLERGAPANADPAVGDALPAFAAYLCSQKHVQKGTHSLTVKRGENQGRQSIIHLEIDNTEESPLQLRIGGAAVMTSKGEITAI